MGDHGYRDGSWLVAGQFIGVGGAALGFLVLASTLDIIAVGSFLLILRWITWLAQIANVRLDYAVLASPHALPAARLVRAGAAPGMFLLLIAAVLALCHVTLPALIIAGIAMQGLAVLGHNQWVVCAMRWAAVDACLRPLAILSAQWALVTWSGRLVDDQLTALLLGFIIGSAASALCVCVRVTVHMLHSARHGHVFRLMSISALAAWRARRFAAAGWTEAALMNIMLIGPQHVLMHCGAAHAQACWALAVRVLETPAAGIGRAALALICRRTVAEGAQAVQAKLTATLYMVSAVIHGAAVGACALAIFWPLGDKWWLACLFACALAPGFAALFATNLLAASGDVAGRWRATMRWRAVVCISVNAAYGAACLIPTNHVEGIANSWWIVVAAVHSACLIACAWAYRWIVKP